MANIVLYQSAMSQLGAKLAGMAPAWAQDDSNVLKGTCVAKPLFLHRILAYPY